MSIDMKTWRTFAAAHAPDFTSTVFLPGLVTDPQHLGRLIDSSLRTATRHAPGDLRLRAFRPGAFDYLLTKRFVDSPLTDGESAVEWLARTAGSDEACLAVNDISSWNLQLCDEVAKMIEELVADGVHELPSGTDVYTFVAHSGWTPFGIHKDGEPSLIFHLGPSPKEVWVWHENPFDSSGITPSPSFGHITFEIEEHLGSAERYLLRPGDFLLIPQDTYHVFRNLGPAAFLGLTLYPARTRSLITEALWRAADPAEPLPAYPPACAVADRARTLLADDTADTSLTERVTHELTLAQLRLRTNGHLSRPHRAALPRSAPVADSPLRWSRPGAVAVAPHSGGITLVVRGRTLTVPLGGRADFTALVRATASSAPFTFGELTALLPAELKPDSRAELARALCTLGAVIAA
ncbi:cupin domain-containing protein [Streptomyces sp. NBC_01565]|uniref:cupin domain-containing protein n=1 Tax=unclassified Streptomyces TaxID=2593676 RepID=UPI002253B17C|nr:cupin domain-containing protein [Streptomyces sp. NBC_01565]MCX4539304.1 cupin domain-containing protein [Streptomyces sp. NBC_01565]